MDALREPSRWVARHSSTERQYSVLYKMGIVRFDGTSRKAIQLVDRADNRRAMAVAHDLIQHGEAIRAKESGIGDLVVPDPNGTYRTPVQTIKPARRSTPADESTIAHLIGLILGSTPSV